MASVLAWENAAEGRAASITVDSEAVGLGIRSVLTPQVADVWRSGPLTPLQVVDISIDLGAARTDLRLFLVAAPADALLPNADALIRITASNVSAGGVEAMDTGSIAPAMAPNGLRPYLHSANVTARWVRFRLTAGATDAYFQLGRVWCGPALVSARSGAYGSARAVQDAGANERAGTSGVRYATRGTTRRVAAWSLPLLTQADADAIEAIARAVGTTGQVFGAKTTANLGRDGVLGAMTQTPSLVDSSFGRTAASISIEEDR